MTAEPPLQVESREELAYLLGEAARSSMAWCASTWTRSSRSRAPSRPSRALITYCV